MGGRTKALADPADHINDYDDVRVTRSKWVLLQIGSPGSLHVPRDASIHIYFAFRNGFDIHLPRTGTFVRVEEGNIAIVIDQRGHLVLNGAGASAEQPRFLAGCDHEEAIPLMRFGTSDCPANILCGVLGLNLGVHQSTFQNASGQNAVFVHSMGQSLVSLDGLRLEFELLMKRTGTVSLLNRLAEAAIIYALQKIRGCLPPELQKREAKDMDLWRLRRSVDLIENNLSHPWSLASLAQEAGMSRTTFANRFHDLLGVPPVQYLTAARMNEAKRLHQVGTITLSEVAGRVGYTSYVAFSRAFKRYFGKGPNACRVEFLASVKRNPAYSISPFPFIAIGPD
jgi:AraC-like DNA-binding protein